MGDDETVTERAHRMATAFFTKMGERGVEARGSDDASALVYHLSLLLLPMLVENERLKGLDALRCGDLERLYVQRARADEDWGELRKEEAALREEIARLKAGILECESDGGCRASKAVRG